MIPQLMPLMWVYSAIMSLYILAMLINMYYYKEEYNLGKLFLNCDNISVKMMW